jgi:lipoprotein-releasing system ATP-binding protein
MSYGVSLRIEGLSKTYTKRGHSLQVLRAIDVEVASGERVAVIGPSGSGKSTFMHLVGMLDKPTSGQIWFDEVSTTNLSDSRRGILRNKRVGFVFQAHHLLPEHTALGNVMIPVRLGGGSRRVAEVRATRLLSAVGLGRRLNHRPGELSGGEQQRVALARALVMAPGLVLADEPTGNLDPKTAAGVFDMMMGLNRQLGSTLVVVTHSGQLAARFPRSLSLENGQFLDTA